jgi:hypothetical protein
MNQAGRKIYITMLSTTIRAARHHSPLSYWKGSHRCLGMMLSVSEPKTTAKRYIATAAVSQALSPASSGQHVFPYENFYTSVLDSKKADNSYRTFRSITRLQKEFPFAVCAKSGKKVDVWCTNDYACQKILD